MDFKSAVRTCLSKYATFSGRAARSEYWYFVLFIFLCQIALGILDNIIFGTGHMTRGPGMWAYEDRGGPLGGIFSLAMLLPMLAAAVRRLHDIDKSGWWLLAALIPLFGWLVLLYFYVQPSQPGANRFGGGSGGAGGAGGNPWGESSVPKVPRG
ncbi:DUF805 domain-containing protein [Sedimentimonas flavescens]|uniref:DUF805 domain-containing protein n=1 Tax=Sedimentimonas flavescens TaxID=2851012 RepID=UPI0021A3A0BB|nr:DUF805 domain-containing protein [Sedimentimonas flavescens]MCT2539904.1 DUF805 domain-containing protein [Sedimentimonas flavescens]WBL33394.1 DUF805 domain-containing protein [Sinirhodobacter sp. HNIBRBA609]